MVSGGEAGLGSRLTADCGAEQRAGYESCGPQSLAGKNRTDPRPSPACSPCPPHTASWTGHGRSRQPASSKTLVCQLRGIQSPGPQHHTQEIGAPERGAHRPAGLQAGVGLWGAVSLTPHPLQGHVETRPRLGLQEGQRLAVWASPQTLVRAPGGRLTLVLWSSVLGVHQGAWARADPRAGGL